MGRKLKNVKWNSEMTLAPKLANCSTLHDSSHFQSRIGSKGFHWPQLTLVILKWMYSTLHDLAQNALQREWGNFPFANSNGICWGLLLKLVQLIKIHFLPHLESFMWEWKFKKNFFKKIIYKPLMGCLLFSNSNF